MRRRLLAFRGAERKGEMKNRLLICSLILVALLCGCSKQNSGTENQVDTAKEQNDLAVPSGTLKESETGSLSEPEAPSSLEVTAPSREEVLAMRQLVLEGMAEEDIWQLTEEVKSANLTLEQAYMWDGLFERLADKDSLYWNYFYEEGEIQIGWAYDGSDEDIAEIQKKEGLSVEEIYEKYGTKVKAYNDCDAESFISLLSGLKETVQTEELRNELQRVMDEIKLAAETREVEHVRNAYMLLHDMDYFLLRYGPEDVGPYVTDKSTISKYYGALSLYSAEKAAAG